MFQIGFGMETDTGVTHWYIDIIRSLCAMLDKGVYSILVLVYQILFNIADTTIFSTEAIKNFYSRIQLVIGIIMIFKLCMSLLQTVVNPDTLTDKSNGIGQLITRIIIMLALFVSIIPLNIPAEEGTYNAYLNESGLLFGTLYSFQSRMLKTNVLGKLILGNSSTDSKSSSNVDAEENASSVASFMLKGFVRINLKEDATEDGAFDSNGKLIESNLMCSSLSSSADGDNDKSEVEIINSYLKPDATINDVIGEINEWCDGPSGDGDQDNYVFAYTPIISTICGALLVVILVGYCVEIAIRAIKLAILRLIAPIPIISYIDPKASKSGAFSAWVKILVTTYIDLFLRLAIVYLIMFMVEDIIQYELDLNIKVGMVGILSTIFVIIGAFYFAKQAPKFIKDALGIKSEGGMGLFSGLGKIAGVGATLAGGIGSARTNYKASKEENGIGGFWNNARNVGSGLVGGISGMAKGGKAAMEAKDHQADAAMKAMNERNIRRASHITAGEGVKNNLSRLFSGKSLADIDEDQLSNMKDELAPIERSLKANQNAASLLAKLKSTAEEQAMKSTTAKGKLEMPTGMVDKNGKPIKHAKEFNYRNLQTAMNGKDSNGYFMYEGQKYNAGEFDMQALKDSQTSSFYNSEEGDLDNKLQGAIRDAKYAAQIAGVDEYDDITYSNIGPTIGDISASSNELTKSIDEITEKMNDLQESRDYRSHKVNSSKK